MDILLAVYNRFHKLVNSTYNFFDWLARFFAKKLIALLFFALVVFLLMLAAVGIGKIYQNWDNDPDRGAIGINDGAFGENYQTPMYLEQGWDEADSLWFYNTTQGSALLPYDFFAVLEQAGSTELFRSDKNIDFYRYLPQKPTFFNPDGLPVGFAKETYKGHDYVGYTCAACHTGQVNYNGNAIRIDGGPAMADMVGFLTGLEKSLFAVLEQPEKQQRFVQNVLALNNSYSNEKQVLDDLNHWSQTLQLYNTVNHSHIDYGYARLDAFGRIYNRVLQHTINATQLRELMFLTTAPNGRRILTLEQIEKVMEGIEGPVLIDSKFSKILQRLRSKEEGYPGLGQKDLLRLRNQIFNEANAPVSYPFLWDIAQSDYVQWNGLAGNGSSGGFGPLGRNTGEVIGVFAILDWEEKDRDGFNLSDFVSGQGVKSKRVMDFASSADLVNLQRLEGHLRTLQSPQWPEKILGAIDHEQADRGRLIYARYCQSCHEVIERDEPHRIVVGKMSDIDFIGTDRATAENGVNYKGKSGNLKHVTQGTDAGKVFVEEDAPVIQILTAATAGAITTKSDPDKWLPRRLLDQLYVFGMAFFNKEMPETIKAGNYKPDTTANPYNSLLAYKARSLNGIWATAPYLHNGSVPTMYDLLLPVKREGDPDDGEYRPEEFKVGSREFDPIKMGFRSEDYDGFKFTTFRVGDMNTGHEYGAGRTPQLDGTVLPALTKAQRMDLIEYIKTL